MHDSGIRRGGVRNRLVRRLSPAALVSRASLACVAVAVLFVSGCASSHAPDAADAASRFYQAFEGSDGATACGLLAPKTREEVERSSGTDCASAILDEQLPSVKTRSKATVFGDQAQVKFGSETVFLAEFPDGWKVVAAGCTPNGDLPYDCEVQA